MTTDQFRDWIKRMAKGKSLSAVAKLYGVSPALLQMVASGARQPSDAFLEKFGMERKDWIQRKKEAAK